MQPTHFPVVPLDAGRLRAAVVEGPSEGLG
jgi:hypothetical protein